MDRFGDKTDRVLRAYVAAGKAYDIAAYIGAIDARSRLFRAIQRLFETYDFLVSPTVTRTALDADFDAASASWKSTGRRLARRSRASPALSIRST